MDKQAARKIREAVEAALAAVQKEHGFKINGTRMTYSADGAFTMKIEGGIVSADGSVVTKEAAAFSQLATVYGFKPEHLGAVFVVMGKSYKIAGIKTRSGRRPVIGTDVSTGKSYVFETAMVQRALGLPVARPFSFDSVSE